ncbi:alcohol dehydrogenase catalytic domain-containing protein [Mycolicibacterium sp. CBM1]
MLAAVLEEFGKPLVVKEVDEPRFGTGEVLVEVLATGIAPYAAEVFSGHRRYPLVPPVISGVGGVGRVLAVGPDATRLEPGELVWCDPMVRSRDDVMSPDITLQGWSSSGEGGLRLSQYFHDGPFAQRMAVPTENAVPLGDQDPAHVPALAAALGVLLVPYGGLLAIELRAGETVVVSGATGNFGSAAVAVALAIGAAVVVCPGRNHAALVRLGELFGPRVRPVRLSGDVEADRLAIQRAAPAPIDAVIDLLPPAASTTPVRAAAMAVRPNGRVVLMGGVGMAGGDDLALPYPWLMRNSITLRGQWMYPRAANQHMIAMIRSGVLDIGYQSVTTFELAEVNEAVAYAAAQDGLFSRTALVPNG